MGFDAEEIQAFKIEADELLEAAERSLLLLDRGAPLSPHYDAIFRAIHSLKGAAGMLDLTDLQEHLHKIETKFTERKGQEFLSKEYVDFFLRGFDGTRTLLSGGVLNFSYDVGRPIQSQGPHVPISPPVAAKSFRGRILVVDDEIEIVNLLTGILNAENIQTHGLTSTADVLETIDSFRPDAIFSDISMPDLNGVELLKLINASHPDVPVAFISGYVNKDVLLDAIKLGVFSVIEKPFDIARVTECGMNAIDRHRMAKMISSSINLLMYAFSDLSEFLKSTGKADIEKIISKEISSLVEQRRAFRKKNSTF